LKDFGEKKEQLYHENESGKREIRKRKKSISVKRLFQKREF